MRGIDGQIRQKADPDDHVGGMHQRHEKIEDHEQFHMLWRDIGWQIMGVKINGGNEMIVILDAVFGSLDRQERHAQDERGRPKRRSPRPGVAPG